MKTTGPEAITDPLGEALHVLRVRGAFYCRSELTAPWGLTVPAMEQCLWFHVVTSGQCRLEVDGAQPQLIGAGELVLVPHGEGHRLRSEAGVTAPIVYDLPHDYASDVYAILRYGGGGTPTNLVCGAVRFDHPAAMDLVSLLPKTLHLDPSASAEPDWLHNTLRLMAAEAAELRPGGETVVTRLSDILVIQAIRSWISSEPANRPGWLGALSDPRIGRAIALIHRDPARGWTVASLANELAMSRSAFAARFTDLVGEPAMTYLARWRMHLARTWLTEEDRTVADVAHRLGYGSEAAFSRAFKRLMGLPPSAVRR